MMSFMQIPNVYCNFPYWIIYQKIYNECNMGRFLQLATFHEGIFFLTAYTNVAKGNKLHIEDLVRAVGARGGGCNFAHKRFLVDQLGPEYVLNFFSHLSKNLTP